MKQIAHILLIVLFGWSCSEKKQTLTIENPFEFKLDSKEVIITSGQLQPEAEKLPVFKDTEGKSIPSQVEDLDGDGNWDQVAFQLTMDAGGSIQLVVDWVERSAYPTFDPKTQVYFGYDPNRTNNYESVDQHIRPAGHEPQDPPYMYQFEGPGWENNLVGFRSYFDTRNGKDIWGKTTEDLVLQDVALGENYHSLQPWGLDVLKVGSSLGAGSLAILKDDSLIRLGATGYAEFKKVAEGPLYSKMKLIYKDWDVFGEMYELEETITLWANKRWYQSDVVLSKGGEKLATGIVNLMDADVEQLDEGGHRVLLTHGDQSENKDALGMALIIPNVHFDGVGSAPTEGDGITNSEMAFLSDQNSNYRFYFYAAWEGENEQFSDIGYFRKDIRNTCQELQSELMVTIK